MPDAFAHCISVTRSHYENFPVASFLIPRDIRPHVCAIYAFARAADDFADEPGLDPAARLARLDEWGERLDRCLDRPVGPVFTALAATIRQHDVPVDLLADLLLAFRTDVTVQRHATFDDLLAYCRCSVVPVGRLVLHLFGYRDEERTALSDFICSALQLANFWQDVAVDFSRGRIYLPQGDMQAFGVTENDLAATLVTDGFRALMTDLTARTEALFLKGRRLPELVSGRLKYELRLTWLGGMEILRKLRRNNHDVFHRRPAISRFDTMRLLLRSAAPLPGHPG